MFSYIRRIRICVAVSALPAFQVVALAQEPVDEDAFVKIVLRSHPGARQAAGLEKAAEAERKAGRVFPDPVFEYSRDRATPADARGFERTETSYSIAQTIPWLGTFSAGARAGDRGADVLRANAEALRWELAAEARKAFARLVAARARQEIAGGAEEDARSLRDLVTQRADLGEARESDRIKATVEWLRQQRSRAATEREAQAAENVARALAGEALPRPLALVSPAPPPPPALDREALMAEALQRSPRLVAARAEALKQEALRSAASRARVPDLDASVFWAEEIDKKATGFTLGLKLPLWGRNRGALAKAEAAVQTAAADSERARLDLLNDIEGRLTELQIAAGQAALLTSEILPAATRSNDLARFSFQEGETSLLDLLDAQRTLRDTQREAVETRLASSIALAELQKLLGPDFNPGRKP